MELVPKGAGPGCVRAKAGRIRLSSFFPTLDDVLPFLLQPEDSKEKNKEKVAFQTMDGEVQQLLFQTQGVVSRLKRYVHLKVRIYPA